jgi:hypothetical protein
MHPGQTLMQITYFTAHVRNDPEGRQRQSDYLDALASHSPLVAVVDGRFHENGCADRGRCAVTVQPAQYQSDC